MPPAPHGADDGGARRASVPAGTSTVPAGTSTRAPGEPAQPNARVPVDRQDDATLAVLATWDPEAFGKLYDRYCDQIYRVAYRRLRDRQAAEDATADVFFKALRAIASYQPSVAPFSAWLHRIAANAVSDHLRARRPVDSLETAMETPDTAQSVELQAINRIEADRVWVAVDQLSTAQRTAVILRLGHGLPLAEIAAHMDRSEGAVKLLLNRGLRVLRGILAGNALPAREGSVR